MEYHEIINAKDLRVGNLILNNMFVDDWVTIEVDQLFIYIASVDNNLFNRFSKGIDLSEYIMGKLEQVKRKSDYVFVLSENDNCYLELEDHNWDEPCFDVFINGVYVTCVYTLHGLQNLYKALYNEELDVGKIDKYKKEKNEDKTEKA
jgi:hypothetical protein